MNILFVNRMMGIAWGGGENYDYHLAQALERRGHRVVFLTGVNRRIAPPALPADVETVRVETPYLRKYMYRWGQRVRYLPGMMAELDLRLFLRAAARPMDALVRERGIHLVQVLGIPAVARHALDRKLAVALRFPGPPAWFQSGLLRRLARRNRLGVFSHGDAVGYFRRRLGLAIGEIPPGVRTDLFRPPASEYKARLRDEFGFGREDLVLATVGRLVPGKGHAFLLRGLAAAVERVPRVRLLVVGDGPLRKQLEAQAVRLGVAGCVVFRGHQGPEGVARSLAAADLFCLYSDYENYSNAVLEAMASGLGVMANRAGGFPLQIRHGVNGYLITPGDVAGFQEQVVELAARPERRMGLSREAIRFAGQFSWGAAAGRAEALYQSLVRV